MGDLTSAAETYRLAEEALYEAKEASAAIARHLTKCESELSAAKRDLEYVSRWGKTYDEVQEEHATIDPWPLQTREDYMLNQAKALSSVAGKLV